MELDGPSLPAWGVWIEIQIKLAKPYLTPSLPAWGVWIEISSVSGSVSYCVLSLPAWGVWIEIGGVQWPDDER